MQKFPLYSGTSISGEIGILQGLSKYFPSTLSMFLIYLFIPELYNNKKCTALLKILKSSKYITTWMCSFNFIPSFLGIFCLWCKFEIKPSQVDMTQIAGIFAAFRKCIKSLSRGIIQYKFVCFWLIICCSRFPLSLQDMAT